MTYLFLPRVRLFFITVIALLALPGATLAAPPVFFEKLDVTEDVTICGVPGTIHITGVQVGLERGDALMVPGQGRDTFTSEDGRTVVLHFAGLASFSSTDNGDGTMTFTDTYRGLPESIAGGQGGPVLRDAGLITFITIVDTDTGEVLSTHVIVHGPHPEADSDFTIFCDAFLEALGE